MTLTFRSISLAIIFGIATGCGFNSQENNLSNEERFAEAYDDSTMLFDRECQLADALHSEDLDFSSDHPHREVSIIDNFVKIVIDGTFKGVVADKKDQYRYRVMCNYVILDEKYFHFCPDTVTVFSMNGEIVEVHPPYEWTMEEETENEI